LLCSDVGAICAFVRSTQGTGSEGITAEVIVVKSFEELEDRAAEVPGTNARHGCC